MFKTDLDEEGKEKEKDGKSNSFLTLYENNKGFEDAVGEVVEKSSATQVFKVMMAELKRAKDSGVHMYDEKKNIYEAFQEYVLRMILTADCDTNTR